MIRERLRGAGLACGRGLALAALAPSLTVALLVVSILAIPFTLLGLVLAGPLGGAVISTTTRAVRALANQHRRWAGAWSGVEIPEPYRPLPERARRGFFRRALWIVGDPATWRDLLWLLLEAPAGLVLGLLPACIVAYGLEGISGLPMALRQLDVWWGYGPFWPLAHPWQQALVFPLGMAVLAAGVVLGPRILWLHARFTASLLAPTRAAALRRRVTQLADTRAETVDAHATELRRIERDLHDGAQARLVSLGMSIGLAEELLASDPEAARRLLAEARQDSSRALAELRDLVRGIHPPVLAERGLGGAVRALALAVPLPVEVTVELAGRAPDPVESAGYFAVAELLANVAKHSGATRAWVRLGHAAGRLTIEVGDDGTGGATASRPDGGGTAGAAAGGGTGLRGIERRLAAFDGTMTVSSPPGGPTVVLMELPCELSSPRISPSSGKG